MVTQKRTALVWLYAVFAAAWTYWCTRGRDGHLVAAIVGFVLFAILYWLTLYRHRPIAVGILLWYLVILEVAVAIALVINPQLDEMGGMLNLLIPIIVLGIVLGGLLPSRFR